MRNLRKSISIILVVAMIITSGGFTTLANSFNEEKESDSKIVEELKNEFGEEKAKEILNASKKSQNDLDDINNDNAVKNVDNEGLEEAKKENECANENNDVENDGSDNVNNQSEKFDEDKDEDSKLEKGNNVEINTNQIRENLENEYDKEGKISIDDENVGIGFSEIDKKNNYDDVTKYEEENNDKNKSSQHLVSDDFQEDNQGSKSGNLSEEIVEPQNDEEDVEENEQYEEEPEEDIKNNFANELDEKERNIEYEYKNNDEKIDNEEIDDKILDEVDLDNEKNNENDTKIEEELVDEKNNEDEAKKDVIFEEELKDDFNDIDNNFENEYKDSDNNIYEEEINNENDIENDIEENDKEYDNEVVDDNNAKEKKEILEKIEKENKSSDLLKNIIASSNIVVDENEELTEEISISEIKLPSLNFVGSNSAYYKIDGDTLHLSNIDIVDYIQFDFEFTPPWSFQASSITKVVFDNEITPSTTTAYLFAGLTALTEIVGLSNLKTSSVTNMYGMFQECSSLISLDLTSLDTSNVLNMSGMFSECHSLRLLDLTSFNTSNVTDMSNMFWLCDSLKTIIVSENFITTQVIESSSMFLGCENIRGGGGTGYNIDNTDKTYARIDADGASGYFTSKNCVYWYLSNYELHLAGEKPSVSAYIENGGAFDFINSLEGRPSWQSVATSINKVVIDNEIQLTKTMYLFAGLTNITEIQDISNLKTTNVTDMNNMFLQCNSLETLDLSDFRTTNVTDMTNMFYGCNSLGTLVLTTFNTSNVTNMKSMFYNCSSLGTLELASFNTANVTNMDRMFYGCSLLETLDLSSFNTANVINMESMFEGCGLLKTISATESFVITQVSESNNMFLNCNMLEGGNGTVYDSTKVDKTYARVDLEGTPGYFTKSTYTIKYNAMGGVVSEESIRKTVGINVTLATPTKNNYVFKGWFTDSACTIGNEYDGSTDISFTHNDTVFIYAKWEGMVYKITLDNNGATTVGMQELYEKYNDGIYGEQSCISLKTSIITPLKTRYFFDGYWNSTFTTQYINKDGLINTSNFTNTTFASDEIIYAKWGGPVYKITLDDMGASTKGTQELYECYNKGIYAEESCISLVTSITKPSRTNYVFGGYWDNTFTTQYIKADGSINSANFTDTKFNSDARLYAKWNKSSSGNGSGGGGGGIGKAPKISYEPLKTNAKSGILRLQDIVVNLDNYEWIQNPIDSTWSLNIDKKGLVASALNKIYDDNYKLLAKNSFCNIEGSIYYFDENEKMTTGWLKNELGEMYLFEWQKNADEGKMVRGWKLVNNNWYYFREDGRLLIYGITPDGFMVDADGIYVENGENIRNIDTNTINVANETIEKNGPNLK